MMVNSVRFRCRPSSRETVRCCRLRQWPERNKVHLFYRYWKKQAVHGLWHSASFSMGGNLWGRLKKGELSMGDIQRIICGKWSAGIVRRELSRWRGLGNGWVLSGQIFLVCRELSRKCSGEMFWLSCRTRNLNCNSYDFCHPSWHTQLLTSNGPPFRGPEGLRLELGLGMDELHCIIIILRNGGPKSF